MRSDDVDGVGERREGAALKADLSGAANFGGDVGAATDDEGRGHVSSGVSNGAHDFGAATDVEAGEFSGVAVGAGHQTGLVVIDVAREAAVGNDAEIVVCRNHAGIISSRLLLLVLDQGDVEEIEIFLFVWRGEDEGVDDVVRALVSPEAARRDFLFWRRHFDADGGVPGEFHAGPDGLLDVGIGEVGFAKDEGKISDFCSRLKEVFFFFVA